MIPLPRLWCCGLAGSLVLGWAGAVQGQVPNLGAPPAAEAPATPTISGGRIVRPTLRPGSQGDAVKELQSMLMLLGYHSGPVSGVYQDDTEAAVKRFQTAAGITDDGIVGPATWSQLFPTPPSEANPPTATPGSPQTAQPDTAQAPAQDTPQEAQPSPAPSAPPSTPSTTPSTAAAERPVLRPGMDGDDVRHLQRRLTSQGFYNGPISGFFGPQTEAAVRQAQTDNNLTVDGIVGPATWGVLD
jgi:N-acetylmuramoyl-L-alanine amidase